MIGYTQYCQENYSYFADLQNVSILSHSPAEPGYTLPLQNRVDPDHLASKEANWSGSALFVILYVNLYQQPGSSYLIGWQLEVGVAS